MAATLVCALLLTCATSVYSGTTTRRPVEMDTFVFTYDPTVHILGVTERYHGTLSCYLLSLSADEQLAVHTTDGMTRLELKMLTHLNSASKTAMTIDELTNQSKRLAHACAHTAAIYTLSI